MSPATIINVLTHIPADAWASAFAIVGVSAFQQKLKKWMSLESPRVLVLMTSVFSLAGAIIPAILGWMSAAPQDVVAHSALWFTGLTLAYRYIVQPGGSFMSQVQAEKERQAKLKAADTVFTEPVDPDKDYLDTIANAPLTGTNITPAAVAVPPGVSQEFEG